jgi:hypothetical protein
MSVIVKLLSKFDDSGIKKAKHSFSGLKHAIGAIGIGIGVSQITNLLIDSAKAASADAKSTKLLNTQLVRNAHATKDQIKQSDKFIEKLSLQTGIFDDDLRPAYGKFARVTKDVHKAQGLLTLALDTSATTGKPLEKVSNAISQAFIGNKTQLLKLFPALKTSTDLFGDLEKIVGGAAIQQADPFDKFNNSMDILKEKLGNVVLPMIADLVTEMTKPGGIVETVGKFFEQLSNPKTKPGKMFVDIKNAVKDAFNHVKDFFALFGNGDAMKGFGNVAGALVKMLPALIALKGIMMLANAGQSIANLVKAMTLIGAGNAASGAGREGFFSKLTTKNKLLGVALMWSIPLIIGTEVFDSIDRAFQDPKRRQQLADAAQTALKPSKFMPKAVNGIFVDKNGYDSAGNFVGKTVGGGASSSPGLLGGKTKGDTFTTYITVNSTNADPKAVVDAVSKYVKTNGGVPSAWGIPKGTVFHGSGH